MSPDATEFTLSARPGDGAYSIAANRYLRRHASTVSYDVTVTIGDGQWAYHETTMLKMDEFPDLFPHIDHNTLYPA